MSLISEFIKIMKMCHFRKFYHFKIVISAPGQISKIHIINFRILKQKCVLLPENSFWVRTDFTVAHLNIPQNQNIFRHWLNMLAK